MRRQKIRTAVAKGADPHHLKQCWPWVVLWFWRGHARGEKSLKDLYPAQPEVTATILTSVQHVAWCYWLMETKKLLLHDSFALCDCRAGLQWPTQKQSHSCSNEKVSVRTVTGHTSSRSLLGIAAGWWPHTLKLKNTEHCPSSFVSDTLLKCLNQTPWPYSWALDRNSRAAGFLHPGILPLP